MALTLPRWLAAAVAGFLALTAMILGYGEEQPRPPNARRTWAVRETRAAVMAGNAASRLRAMQLRDSVRWAAGTRRELGSRVLVSAGFSQSVHPMLRSLAARTSMVQAGRAEHGIDIAMVFDTIASLRGRPISRAPLTIAQALPTEPGSRCLSLARVIPRLEASFESGWWRREFPSEENALRLLGPCGFYEAFGAPGRGVDRWLRDGAWRFGIVGAWSREYRTPEGWDAYWNSSVPWHVQAGWPLRGNISEPGYRCVAGDISTCRELVLDPASARGAASYRRIGPDGIVSIWTLGWWDVRPLGTGEPALLAEMVRSLGVERFQKFWSSDLAPADAFLTATGQDLGEWAAAWARRSYGEQSRGPGLNARAIAFALVIVTAALLMVTAAARRRQVA